MKENKVPDGFNVQKQSVQKSWQQLVLLFSLFKKKDPSWQTIQLRNKILVAQEILYLLTDFR